MLTFMCVPVLLQYKYINVTVESLYIYNGQPIITIVIQRSVFTHYSKIDYNLLLYMYVLVVLIHTYKYLYLVFNRKSIFMI